MLKVRAQYEMSSKAHKTLRTQYSRNYNYKLTRVNNPKGHADRIRQLLFESFARNRDTCVCPVEAAAQRCTVGFSFH